jgi:hypothetical protein
MKTFVKLSGWIIANLIFASAVSAQNSTELPQWINKLVPRGTTLESQTFYSSPASAQAGFTAVKKAEEDRRIEYQFGIHAYDNTSPSWKMMEAAYRNDMDSKITSSKRGLAPTTVGGGMFTADPVKETKYSWGSGITQKIRYHLPQAKEFVAYNCVYYGMVGSIVFTLSVNGIPDNPNEVDKWAEAVALAISEVTISNIGK